MAACGARRTTTVPVAPLGAPAASAVGSPSASASAITVDDAWRPPLPGTLAGAGVFRATTAHGGGVYTIRVVASDPSAYASAAVFPSETVICAEHRRASSGADGPLACMRKRGETWRFAIALPPFGQWEREGPLSDCGGCHATAARDGVFGPP